MARDHEAAPQGPFGTRTFLLGRVFGISVGVDPSWFVIFALVTAMLGTRFEAQNESWPTALAWGAGLVASLLYFLSILAHEFGHSVTSQLLGLPVISITLFLFGGLARLSGEPARPRDEFLIAIAGPAVSVILGLSFLLLWIFTGNGSVVGEVCFWLGSINLVLAVFNLIPAFPLDGGHVFRALLWTVFDDLNKATRWSGLVGALFARVLIGMGIALAIFGGPQALSGGLFMAFVGWFLLRAARASVWQSRIKESLGGVRVGQAMQSLERRVDEWTTVEDVAEGVFAREGLAFVFVEDSGEVVGLVSLKAVGAVARQKRGFQRVTSVMTPLGEITRIGPRRSLFEALEKMEDSAQSVLLVAEADEVLGVLSREHIARVLQNRISLKN